MLEQGTKMKRKEQQRQHNELTTTLYSLAARDRKVQSEVEPRKKGLFMCHLSPTITIKGETNVLKGLEQLGELKQNYEIFPAEKQTF